MNKKIISLLAVVALFSILYRVLPYRVDGFNPMYALSLFSGFIFSRNKKYSVVTPLLAMLLSDVVYEILYIQGIGLVKGFYGWGQILQYISILAVSVVGFYINKVNAFQVAVSGIVGASLFFVLSNFFVWVEGMGYQHAYTLSGLVSCFIDGVPFYKATLLSTVLFSALIFTIYHFMVETNRAKEIVR